jgi:hypothetical protein
MIRVIQRSALIFLDSFYINHKTEIIMRSMICFLLLLLCSCNTKQNLESKDWTALYLISHDSLIITDAKDFTKLNESMIQSSDYFLKMSQNNVSVNNQIIRKSIFAEILDKKGAVVNSVNITTYYPSEKNELIRYSVYIAGEIKLYPFSNVTEFSNLNKTFDELSALLVKENNRK